MMNERHEADDTRREHSPHEIHRRELELVVDVEVLRVADGSEHTAEVCGGGLEDYRANAELLVLGVGENHEVERDEGYQRDVVGDEHGREEAEQYEN